MNSNNDINSFWLTDFCESMRLFVAVVMIQILVIVYSLSFLSFDAEFLRKLSILSLLAQLIGLLILILLCKLRSFFNGFNVYIGLTILAAVVITITTLISQLIGWLDLQLSFHLFSKQQNINYINIKLSVSALIICFALIRYFYIQDHWKLEIQKLSESRLRALQSRIKPHFLFNTLNSIASMVTIDSEKAEAAIENLSSLMRRTFVQHDKEVFISEELKFVGQYLSIEKLRLAERLDYEISCEDDLLNFKIPLLSIQPLVENAIIHGIQPLEKGGKIKVNIYIQNRQLIIQVTNPFQLKANNTINGIALKNIEERLKLLYGPKSAMAIDQSNHLFEIKLKVPI